MSEIFLDSINPNNRADYIIKPDGTGIILTSFTLARQMHQVLETLIYAPEGNGRVIPGAGQVGLYKVTRFPGSELLAVIRDYRRESEARPWEVALLDLTDNPVDLLNKYAKDPDRGITIYLGLSLAGLA